MFPMPPIKKTETPLTKAELEEEYQRHPLKSHRVFIDLIQDGDKITRVRDGNTGMRVTYLLIERLVGENVRDGTVIKIYMTESVMMS